MEKIISILIYIHAFLGGIGLLSGIASVLVRKGGLYHKSTGKIFSYAMLCSSLISLVIASMPGHESLFLLLIGVFTIYLVLMGVRFLKFRDASRRATSADSLISSAMLCASLVMLIIGAASLFREMDNSVLYVFFGAFGSFLSFRDIRFFKKSDRNKTLWLKYHLGRMIGALIASVTAFMVAGLDLTGLIFWISPTALGTVYIFYWNRRLDNKLWSWLR